MVFRLLDDQIIFPNTALAEKDGLLAIGGDLSVDRLKLAYQSGIFPWFSEDDPILWFAPHERCVIFPENIKVSKSMKKILNSLTFRVTENLAFEKVIMHCAYAERKDQDGTWITDEMQQAYLNLHQEGIAQSIEVWQNEALVGGLYGIKVGRIFCGESMFSTVSNASKMGLIYLCQTNRYDLIDCQVPNDHLMSLGAEMISREKYLNLLRKNLI